MGSLHTCTQLLLCCRAWWRALGARTLARASQDATGHQWSASCSEAATVDSATSYVAMFVAVKCDGGGLSSLNVYSCKPIVRYGH